MINIVQPSAESYNKDTDNLALTPEQRWTSLRLELETGKMGSMGGSPVGPLHTHCPLLLANRTWFCTVLDMHVLQEVEPPAQEGACLCA